MTEFYCSMIINLTRIIFLLIKMKKQNNFLNIIIHPKNYTCKTITDRT